MADGWMLSNSASKWERLLTDRFLPGSVVLKGHGVGGHLDQHARFDPLWLAQLSVQPQSIAHGSRDLVRLSADERESVVAHIVIEGNGFIEQGNAGLSFEAGDISFRNLSEPSRVVFESPSRFFTIRLPAPTMRIHRVGMAKSAPLPPLVVHRTDTLADATPRLLSGMVMDGSLGVTDFLLSSAIPWVLAAAYLKGAAPRPLIQGANEFRWQQALEHIELHLYDADRLSAASCARALAVSERYLHYLFAQRGCRFSETVLAKRLAAAQTMLQCENYKQEPIASIAYKCGFKDPAHFSRAFKRRYGISPSSYRCMDSGVN